MQVKAVLFSLAVLASSVASDEASNEAISLIQTRASPLRVDESDISCKDAKKAARDARAALKDLKKQMKDARKALKEARDFKKKLKADMAAAKATADSLKNQMYAACPNKEKAPEKVECTDPRVPAGQPRKEFVKGGCATGQWLCGIPSKNGQPANIAAYFLGYADSAEACVEKVMASGPNCRADSTWAKYHNPANSVKYRPASKECHCTIDVDYTYVSPSGGYMDPDPTFVCLLPDGWKN